MSEHSTPSCDSSDEAYIAHLMNSIEDEAAETKLQYETEYLKNDLNLQAAVKQVSEILDVSQDPGVKWATHLLLGDPDTSAPAEIMTALAKIKPFAVGKSENPEQTASFIDSKITLMSAIDGIAMVVAYGTPKDSMQAEILASTSLSQTQKAALLAALEEVAPTGGIDLDDPDQVSQALQEHFELDIEVEVGYSIRDELTRQSQHIAEAFLSEHSISPDDPAWRKLLSSAIAQAGALIQKPDLQSGLSLFINQESRQQLGVSEQDFNSLVSQLVNSYGADL